MGFFWGGVEVQVTDMVKLQLSSAKQTHSSQEIVLLFSTECRSAPEAEEPTGEDVFGLRGVFPPGMQLFKPLSGNIKCCDVCG